MTKTTARSAANSRRLPLRTLIIGAVAGVLVTTAPILPAAAVPSAPLVQPETSNTAVDVPADDAPPTVETAQLEASETESPDLVLEERPTDNEISDDLTGEDLLPEIGEPDLEGGEIAKTIVAFGAELPTQSWRHFWVNTPGRIYRFDIDDDFPEPAGTGPGESDYSLGLDFKSEKTYGDIAVTPDGKTLYGLQYTSGLLEGNGVFSLDKYDAQTGVFLERADVNLKAIAGQIRGGGKPQLNSLSVDYDGKLIFGSGKTSKIWKIDPAVCFTGGCSIGNGVTELNMVFPEVPKERGKYTQGTAAGDFFAAADGSLYGIATNDPEFAEGVSTLVRWPAKVPGDPSQGRQSQAIVIGHLKIGRDKAATWGGGRIEDQLLFARAGSSNELLKHGVQLEGNPTDGVDDKLGPAELIEPGAIKDFKSLFIGQFYGATSEGDGGLVPGHEKILVVEKEVSGPRVDARDNFLIYSHREGGRSSMGIPVLAADANVLATNTDVDGQTGVQPNKHFSYVTVGKQWTVVEELYNSAAKTDIEKYGTTLKCVQGNNWEADAAVEVTTGEVKTEDIPVTEQVQNGPTKRRFSTFQVPQFESNTLTCRFVNAQPGLNVEKLPRSDQQPAVPADPNQPVPEDQRNSLAQEVRVDADGKATATYVVELKNASDKQVTSGEIKDKIRVPQGVTSAGDAKVTSEVLGDGNGTVEPPATTWTMASIVPDAELTLADQVTLDPKQTARFTIQIPIQVDQNLADEQWDTLGTCIWNPENNGAYEGGGLPNDVIMEGDQDGVENNTACIRLVRDDTPPPPGQISVEKYPRADREPAEPIKVGADGKATLKYTVEAKNDSAQKATSADIKDRIRLPQGVTADGDATITAEDNGTVNGPTLSWIQSQIVADAELPLAQSVTLEPGQKATFTITIPVKVDANLTDEQWSALGTCEAGGANAPGSPGGVPNDVIMANDEDGPGNNTACVPLEPEHTGEISVQKFPRPDRDPAPAVKVGPDGKATLTYTVEATNASNQQLTSAAITDKLRLPAGVTPSGEATITSGIVDDGPGTIDSAAQRWTLEQMTGTDALPLAASVTLDPGQTARFTISIPIQVQVNPALSDEQWNELGTCEWTTGEKPTYTTGGVPNDVAMDNDEDGPENNTACITLVREEEPPVGLQLYKLGMNDDGGYTQLADSTFQVFAAGAQPGELGPVVGDAVVNPDGVASISNLALGANYYLVETKAPAGYELLAQPVCFTLKRDGAQAVAAACDGTTLDAAIMFNNPTADGQYLNADTAVISVADVRAGLLPASGTAGLLMRLALGGLVAAAGCAMVLRREGVSTGKW